jgi:chemotaxis protein CheC
MTNQTTENIENMQCIIKAPALGNESCQLSELEILLELGSIGAGHAATSLSDVLQQQVTIEVPRICKTAPHLIPQFYQRHDALTTAVYMQLDNSQCDMLLMFDPEEAKKIAAMMTMTPSVEELDPELEGSAIQELANILIGSFLTAISDFTSISLIPTTPHTAKDAFDAIIDGLLAKQQMISSEALIFETRFKREGEDAKSFLILFPSPQLQNLLVEKSRELLGA